MKKVKELVTYSDDRNACFFVERTEELMKEEAKGGRKSDLLETINLDRIIPEGVVTGVGDGYRPLALYGNEDFLIEVANCDREQAFYHRNLDEDEWIFQYKGERTIRTELGEILCKEGDVALIPKGVAHQSIGHGPNIQITIYAKKRVKRLVPKTTEKIKLAMKSDHPK
jgi:hypothetical protein